jgi:RNA polymerase sigma-70 factor (ECF subfamily)
MSHSEKDEPLEGPSGEEIAPHPREEREGGLFAGVQDTTVLALVERAKSGDAEALNELFSRYHGTMVDLARMRLGSKLRSKEEADDLAQTTFREATRDFGQYEYRGEGSLLNWLAQILQNKIRDRAEYYSAGRRDVTRERSTDERTSDDGGVLLHEAVSRDLSVTSVVQRDEEFAILRQALDELSADHRRAIALVFFQGLSLRQAGEQLGGRSEDAVRMLLRRAESRVRELTHRKLES